VRSYLGFLFFFVACSPAPLPPAGGGRDRSEAEVPHACVDSVVSAQNDLSHVQGGRIAFTLRDADGLLQIFTANPDGSDKRELTFEGQNGLPDWSPDGTQIAFITVRSDGPYLAVMREDGANQRIFSRGGVAPDWSPDGHTLAFSKDSQIWVVNPDGSGERQVTSSATTKARPSWSPDARRLVFILVGNPGNPTDPQPQIGIVDADGVNERRLTVDDRTNVCAESDGGTRVLETAHDANAPAWSPVDDRIAFWSGIENHYGQVWTTNADGTDSRQLTEETKHSNNDDPSWSPDGTKILFSTGRSGQNEPWVMDADGRNEMRLFPIDAGPFPGRASWQPRP